MPNWCFNTISISHENPEMIQRFVEAAKRGELFSEFVPLNEEGEWEYGAAVIKWGTKWEPSAGIDITECSPNEAAVWFDTAWSPPIAFYDSLIEMGFNISAQYHEPGMAFAGTYDNGEEQYFEYDFSDPNWDKDMPEDLAEFLYPEYEHWEDCQSEEEE